MLDSLELYTPPRLGTFLEIEQDLKTTNLLNHTLDSAEGNALVAIINKQVQAKKCPVKLKVGSGTRPMVFLNKLILWRAQEPPDFVAKIIFSNDGTASIAFGPVDTRAMTEGFEFVLVH